MKNGFSTLEIIISIAIASVILAILTNSYQVAKLKKNQEEIIEAITVSLDEQKTQSQAGKDGSNFGVQFDQTAFTLFTGTSFNPSSNQNKVIAIDSQFEITETISNSDNMIYFSKLLGDANETATITISHIDDRIPQKNILIEKSGTISVIE